MLWIFLSRFTTGNINQIKKGYLPLLHIWNNSFLWVSLVAVYQCLQMLLQEHREHKPHVPIWASTKTEGEQTWKHRQSEIRSWKKKDKITIEFHKVSNVMILLSFSVRSCVGLGCVELSSNYFKKKWIPRFLEPWTPATVCYDRISNVDFREENLKSNIKISIWSKQQLHSLICCVFHALVKE